MSRKPILHPVCEHFHQYRRMAASAEPKGPFLLMFRIYLLWLIISFYIIYCRTFYGLSIEPQLGRKCHI
jgi:hypothetical protein